MVDILELLKGDTTIPARYQAMTVAEMEARVSEIKAELGDKLFIPAHHYQKNEIVQFADVTGDSLQLAQVCQQNKQAEYIIFCGVHFLVETDEMLIKPETKLTLSVFCARYTINTI